MKILSHSENLSISLRRRIGQRRYRSSMTIYLSLVLVIILALICTLTESGRVSAMHARLRSITYMAADSVFAEFAQPLFDEYGVLMLWEDEEGFRENFDDYVTKTLDISGTGAGMDMDLYGMRYQGCEMKEVEWIVEKGGRPFADQVVDYMKVHAIEGIAEELLSRTDFFEQTEKVRGMLAEINGLSDEFTRVEEGAAELSQKVERVKDLAENPKTLLEEMEKKLKGFDEAGAQETEKAFSSGKKKLRKTKQELSGELEKLQEQTEQYYKDAEAARAAAASAKEKIDLDEDSMDPDIYRAVSEKMKDLEEIANVQGEEYRKIRENADQAKAYLNTLSGLEQYFQNTEGSVSADNLAQYLELTQEYKTKMSGFSLSSLKGKEEAEGKRKSSGFIRSVNKTYKKGVLDLLAGEISEKQVDRSEFPSVTGKKEKDVENEEGIVDKSLEKALFSEYIREHFGCFTQVKEDSALDYEIEYILAGKETDRDNLSSAVTKLVLIRIGSNLVSLMTDGKKQAEIHELAVSIIGYTGQMYLVKLAEILIEAVWATAEAMLDVRSLLEGKKVPLLKQSGDWFLSLEGLQKFTGKESTSSSEGNGLSYEEYLCAMLLLQNREKQIFHTMDVIQANMCVREHEDFRMKDCMVGVGLEASFRANSVFVQLPVVRRTVSGGGTYGFSFTQNYSY